MPELICRCGNRFYVTQSKSKKDIERFCSKSCKNIYQLTKYKKEYADKAFDYTIKNGKNFVGLGKILKVSETTIAKWYKTKTDFQNSIDSAFSRKKRKNKLDEILSYL